jgi:hypothetical protein
MNADAQKSESATVYILTKTVQRKTPLFSLGAVVATPGALDLLDRAGINATPFLARHQYGDFGTLCADDIRENQLAIARGSRILSAYEIGDDGERLWIITEACRSVTTLLLPREY